MKNPVLRVKIDSREVLNVLLSLLSGKYTKTSFNGINRFMTFFGSILQLPSTVWKDGHFLALENIERCLTVTHLVTNECSWLAHNRDSSWEWFTMNNIWQLTKTPILQIAKKQMAFSQFSLLFFKGTKENILHIFRALICTPSLYHKLRWGKKPFLLKNIQVCLHSYLRSFK